MADFIGRTSELDLLADLADRVRAGEPQIAWVRGVAGIGKTTVVRRFLAGLGDFTVLAAAADASESLVDHGVVGQLVRRLSASARAASPLLAGPVPADASPLAVGAGLLDVLGSLQASGSVAVVVDDAHWADASSLQALGFVLRRVWADQVLVVLVTRLALDERTAGLVDRLVAAGPAVTTINLTGFGLPEVAEMSREVNGSDLSGAAVERLRAFTGGHPLYLRTLLAEVPPDALAARYRRIAVPPSLVTAVRAVSDRLPQPTRDLVEALAVLGGRGPLARAALVARVTRPGDALQPALDAGIVQWWPGEPSNPVGIGHALQREAIYTALSPARRVELHQRAAAVVDRAASWSHRVAAAGATDEGLARELEEAAAEQAGRGHHGLAAEYLRWATDLSPERADHERRLLTAGVQVLFSRDRHGAAPLWTRMEQCAHSALRSLCLGLTALFSRGEWAAAQRWLAEALELSGAPGVPRWVRASAAAGLAGAHAWAGQVDETEEAARLALSIGDLPVLLHDYTYVLLAVGATRSGGMVAGLDELSHLAPNPGAVPAEQLDSLACRGSVLAMLGRYHDAQRDLSNVIHRQRTGTFMIGGATPYCYLAACHYQLGEWDEAAVLMRQAWNVADEDEQPHARVLRRMAATLVPAGRGEWEEASEHVRVAQQLARRVGGPQDLRYAAIGAAVLHQSRGDHVRMYEALCQVPGLDVDGTGREDGSHRWWDLWWRPLLIEALLGLGRTAAAGAHLEVLRTHTAGVPLLGATTTWLTASYLDAAGDRASALEEAERFLASPEREPAAFADSLLEHDHARRLLSAGRRDEAMTALTSARRRFGKLGAAPFERRVAADLRRCGEPDRVPHATIAGLTDREWEVARLVGRDLTNREIGARLYVTTKTVEYHLGNIYSKLAITSRRALRELLVGARPAEVGP